MRHIIIEASTLIEARVRAEAELNDGEALGDVYRIRGNRWHVEIIKDLEELNQ